MSHSTRARSNPPMLQREIDECRQGLMLRNMALIGLMAFCILVSITTANLTAIRILGFVVSLSVVVIGIHFRQLYGLSVQEGEPLLFYRRVSWAALLVGVATSVLLLLLVI